DRSRSFRKFPVRRIKTRRNFGDEFRRRVLFSGQRTITAAGQTSFELLGFDKKAALWRKQCVERRSGFVRKGALCLQRPNGYGISEFRAASRRAFKNGGGRK